MYLPGGRRKCLLGLVFSRGIDHLANARTELLSQLHRYLRHTGISLGVPGLAQVPTTSKSGRAELMAQSDLFGVIESAQKAMIADHLTEMTLQPGETLIEQDMKPTALFLVASGTLEVTVRSAEPPPRVVHRMGPGESGGAIGLITGDPYAATATALTDVRAYRLDKESIAAAITKMPSLERGLEALAERSQAALRSNSTAPEHQAREDPELFLAKLRSFILLLDK